MTAGRIDFQRLSDAARDVSQMAQERALVAVLDVRVGRGTIANRVEKIREVLRVVAR